MIKTLKVIAVVVLIFSLAAVQLFAASKSQIKTNLTEKGLICSFETLPSETSLGDFDWNTNGYVLLEQFKKYATKGKHSCMATFLIPAEFKTSEKTKKIAQWHSAMDISIETITKLKITDWTKYKTFRVDIYTKDETPRNFYIKFFDAAGREYLVKNELKKGRNKLKVKLQDLKTARIDLGGIVTVSLYLDMAKEEKNVVLYVDSVRIQP